MCRKNQSFQDYQKSKAAEAKKRKREAITARLSAYFSEVIRDKERFFQALANWLVEEKKVKAGKSYVFRLYEEEHEIEEVESFTSSQQDPIYVVDNIITTITIRIMQNGHKRVRVVFGTAYVQFIDCRKVTPEEKFCINLQKLFDGDTKAEVETVLDGEDEFLNIEAVKDYLETLPEV